MMSIKSRTLPTPNRFRNDMKSNLLPKIWKHTKQDWSPWMEQMTDEYRESIRYTYTLTEESIKNWRGFYQKVGVISRGLDKEAPDTVIQCPQLHYERAVNLYKDGFRRIR